MVGAYDFSFWSRNLFARIAHRAVPHVWRHPLRGALVHGAHGDRTKIRHGSCAAARHVFGPGSTSGARLVAVLHLATFSAVAAERNSSARIFAHGRQCYG